MTEFETMILSDPMCDLIMCELYSFILFHPYYIFIQNIKSETAKLWIDIIFLSFINLSEKSFLISRHCSLIVFNDREQQQKQRDGKGNAAFLVVASNLKEGFRGSTVIKNLPANVGDASSISRSGRYPGVAPTPVFLPRESHGQRNLGRLRFMGSERVGHDWVTEHTGTSFSFVVMNAEDKRCSSEISDYNHKSWTLV